MGCEGLQHFSALEMQILWLMRGLFSLLDVNLGIFRRGSIATIRAQVDKSEIYYRGGSGGNLSV